MILGFVCVYYLSLFWLLLYIYVLTMFGFLNVQLKELFGILIFCVRLSKTCAIHANLVMGREAAQNHATRLWQIWKPLYTFLLTKNRQL